MTLVSALLSNIPWDDIPARGLIVTRLEGERLDAFIYALRDHVGDTTKVVPMSVAAEILVIDEETMERMGWVRKS